MLPSKISSYLLLLHWSNSGDAYMQLRPTASVYRPKTSFASRRRPRVSALSSTADDDSCPSESTHPLLNRDAVAVTTRRMMFASSLITAGALLAAANPAESVAKSTPDLPWAKDPINPKRSTVRVADAEKLGYNVSFVTYLTRFLLNFDPVSQQWWIDGAKEIPEKATKQDIFKIRVDQFSKLAASVEVGLQDFGDENGPTRLLESLLKRYCPTDPISLSTSGSTSDEKRTRREIKEARRQLALMFALLGDTQPTKEISQLLASVDNGSVSCEFVLDEKNPVLRGFAPDDAPTLVMPPPQAGLEGYEQATVNAVMKPTGQLLKLDIQGAGTGYSGPPVVTISPPSGGGEAASATITVSKGKITNVKLTDPGSGYTLNEGISVSIDNPVGVKPAMIRPVLEMAIAGIEAITPGSGYAVEKPLKVSLVPLKGESTVIGFAYPTGGMKSFDAYRVAGDNKVRTFEKELTSSQKAKKGTVSGTSSGGSLPAVPFSSKASSSSQLLALLPQGFGLEYDTGKKRYFLSVDKEFQERFPTYAMQSSNSNRPLVPDFGPLGQSPIERDMNLDVSTFLRFCLSGAICSSGVHLALTPLEVVKTKVQTNPTKYTRVGSSFSTVWKDEGPGTFFAGWLPTFLGYFVYGAVLYAMTETIRRSLTESAGASAESLEALIILAAAGISAAIAGTFFFPFEAVRIRTVAQPEFGKNTADVVTRMLREEGIGSFIDAVPVFLVKQVPYAMVKFTIFDLSTEYLYDQYPAAQEDLVLSLGISLIGGVLGGVSAAIISNPADAVISELKKAKSDQTPQQALQALLDRSGLSSLFTGLPIRMVFYSLTAAMQFLIFDGVRFALGIGQDDLRLYLDVLGGALTQSQGTIA